MAEKQQLLKPWLRWAELFMMALLMSLKEWLSVDDERAATVPLMRLLIDDQVAHKCLQPILNAVVRFMHTPGAHTAPPHISQISEVLRS